MSAWNATNPDRQIEAPDRQEPGGRGDRRVRGPSRRGRLRRRLLLEAGARVLKTGATEIVQHAGNSGSRRSACP